MTDVIEPSVPYDVDAVVRAVEKQYQEWLATLEELVRTPSVSAREPTLSSSPGRFD
jgi:hypothetical protein